MNIKNLELLLKLLDTDNEKESSESKQSAFIVGEKYFIRTVTMAVVGELESIFNSIIININILKNYSFSTRFLIFSKVFLNFFLKSFNNSIELE